MLGKMDKSVAKLIDVIAQGVGGIYGPVGTVRNAKADAKALVIRTQAEIEVASLKERAAMRVEYSEARRQLNVEQIAAIARSELPIDVSEEPVKEDWTLRFFDAAQYVCDEDMQSLWGRILAGEVSAPGAYSLRTIEFLRTFVRDEAELFTTLCSYVFHPSKGWDMGYLIHEAAAALEVQRALGHRLEFEHLIEIGLLHPAAVYWRADAMDGSGTYYFGKRYKFMQVPKGGTAHPFDQLNNCPVWKLTAIGNELGRICGAKPVEGFVDRLSDSLRDQLGIYLEEAPLPPQ